MKNKIRKGQVWKSKSNGVVIVIKGKATGNRHWFVENPNRKNNAHHIHEGTLEKFYELLG